MSPRTRRPGPWSPRHRARASRGRQGSRVRINVSKGPKQILLPSVVGLTYDTAAAQLNAAGFAVRRVDVESDQPADRSSSRDRRGNPPGGARERHAERLERAPRRRPCPMWSTSTAPRRRRRCEVAGFKVKVKAVETSDQTQDDHVIMQDPAGDSQAKPNGKVTITVGRFVEPPADTTTTQPPRRLPRPVTGGRTRVARSRRRPLERARDLTRVRSLRRRRTRPRALRGQTVEIGRDGRWALPRAAEPARAPGRAGRDAPGTDRRTHRQLSATFDVVS